MEFRIRERVYAYRSTYVEAETLDDAITKWLNCETVESTELDIMSTEAISATDLENDYLIDLTGLYQE